MNYQSNAKKSEGLGNKFNSLLFFNLFFILNSGRVRQEEQRKDKKNALKRESSIGEDLNVPSFNHHDADMLEMTLGMLRCSVCKDRFKSVTIKKCFHLFCRECIEENIRSRSRKCPACGEKFGQDDVANIYFTN
jgi:E3 ubiquitin-protein ligase BRE1